MRIGVGLCAWMLVLAQPLMARAELTWVGDAIPASLTGQPGDPAKGRAIVVNRQLGLCTLCHSGPFPEQRLSSNLAPDLSASVARLSPGQLRARLVDPSRMNPETIMPSYYRVDHYHRAAPSFAGKTILSAQEIEDVLAYLMTLQRP